MDGVKRNILSPQGILAEDVFAHVCHGLTQSRFVAPRALAFYRAATNSDDGTPLTENTAVMPFLGKRFGMWPSDNLKEAQALSVIGFFAASVHPAHGHIGRPARYTADESAFPGIQAMGKKTFHEYLKQIDGMYAGREWLGDAYSVLDAYAFVFYTWGVKRELPVAELKNYTALAQRMAQRPAVQRVMADEGVTL